MIAYWQAGPINRGLIAFLEFLCWAIYSLVSLFCKLLTDISNVTIFNDTIIESFTQRIYVILGIYMLFKIAISLLGSIINPDQLLDKEKGMQKIITRSVLALAMLVLFPSVFDIAMEYQDRIARTVPRIITGKGSTSNIEKQGETLAATAFKPFIEPNSQCGDQTDERNTDDLSTLLSLPSKRCDADRNEFRFEFNGIMAIVAGIFMIVSLASYCVDVAIRAIKLGLLRMLAPIPIISYIDPKSEKDGAFGHWVKECTSTYLELFIKLAILYFIIDILAQLASDDGTLLNGGNGNPFVIVFIIIGAFFFMGKASEFICNILGIKHNKDSGGVMGKALGFLGKGALGGAAGAVGALLTGGGLAGLASGALEGMAAGATGKPGAAFNKGRDISAQMKTGDPNAKHKGILTKAGENVRARRAANLGFTADSVDKAKKTMIAANNAAANAESLRARFNAGTARDEDRAFLATLRASEDYKDFEGDDFALLDEYVNDTKGNASKAEKYYQRSEQYANVLGVRTSEPLASYFDPKQKESSENEDDKSKRERKYNEWADTAQAKHKKEGTKGFISDKYAPKKYTPTLGATGATGTTGTTGATGTTGTTGATGAAGATARGRSGSTTYVRQNSGVQNYIDNNLVQDRVITREEHVNRQAGLESVFLNPENASRLDANQAQADAILTSNPVQTAYESDSDLLERYTMDPASLSNDEIDRAESIMQQQANDWLIEEEYKDMNDQFPH